MSQFSEFIKTFSFQTVLRGNILSSPGSFGAGNASGFGGQKSNSPASNMIVNRMLSTYYNVMREINDYEVNDLSNTIVGIYKDYLISYLNKDQELITISDTVGEKYSEIQKGLNEIFKGLDIINEVKNHFWDIIYHGAWCFQVVYDSENRRFTKNYLQNPHNVVTVYKHNDQTSHLVVSRDGKIFETKPESIFRIGRTDLNLINDINENFFDKKKDDTLVRDDQILAGTPLYYYITGKIKEYLLKEQVLALLSIKDLIQPLLLLIRLDKNTSIDEGNKLALNVENMINKYSDISSILSSNFGINSLVDSLMNNIRVIPDYHSGVGDMNNIDLSKITSKIQDIEQSQENKKDAIMNAASIPRALYNGESTKWDAIKSSQRLNSKINSIAVGIADSLKLEARKKAKEVYNIELTADQIEIHLFKKTDVDYALAITNAEIINSLSQGVQQILQNTQQTIQDIKLIDPQEYAKYTLNQLKAIDPSISQFITEETIAKALQEANQDQGQGQQPGG